MAASPARIFSQAGAAVAPIFSVVITGPTTAIVVPFDLLQQSAVNTYLANTFDWSDAAELTWQRLQWAAQLNVRDSTIVALRGAVAVLVSEVNLLRQRHVAEDAVVAAATSLANLQSRWAAMAASLPMADRTLAQARTAITAAINAGTVDS